MMLVDPGQRRTGIGSQLMEAALGALGAETCVRLDATPSGEPLYRRFGFTAESVFARTSITAEAGRFRPSSRVLPMQPEDLPAVCSRDREVFGADRSALLADLYRRAPGFAWIAPDAWCFGRPGYRYQQFGPVVAANAAAARELVEHCLASHPGLTVVLDVPQLSDAFGFTVERPFLRMRRGGRADYGAPEHVFAIAGPEFG
jgi:GNAT superfamily N-acetyltransferase